MLETKDSLESTRNYGDSSIGQLLPLFLKHAQFDLSFSPNTVAKYDECIRTVIRHIGDLQASKISLQEVLDLKAKIVAGGAGESRIAQITFSLKSFLKYCKDELGIDVLDYKRIKSPKRPRREVIFLTNEEIQKFIDSIAVQTTRKKVSMNGLRFRTLVETLLGTGMRISGVLSLNRDSIDFETKEAKIIGKGNKERTVFFTDRAIEWIQYYLSKRTDSERALFICLGGDFAFFL